MHAVRAGASDVQAVDVSQPALDLAEANARMNDIHGITWIRSDVFDQLDVFVEASDKFGMVVLDPPKFARTMDSVEEAMRGYRRLQSQALRLLESDGILVTCCCSGLITAEMLLNLLSHLASQQHRRIQLLERRGQAPDHPVAVTCPETEYLKCFICRVE